jgi:hypothetical protein
MKILMSLLGCLVALAMFTSGLNAQATKRTETKTKQPIATEKVTFVLKGVECQKCSDTLTKIFSDDGVKLDGMLKPSPDALSNVVGGVPVTMDISDLASKIGLAKTPHREKVAPVLMVAVFNEKMDQKADEVKAAIAKVKALDAKATTYDDKTGEINLAFTGKTKISLAELTTELKNAGLMVKLTKHTS